MTLGNFHNIQTPTQTQIVTGNINPKLVILNIDNSSLAASTSYQIVGDGQILYSLSDQDSLDTAHFSQYNLEEDEEEEEEEEEDEEDPDYIPESLVTGTVGEPTEDEQGNLMWLVDFKLDFLSDIDKDENSEEPERKKMKTVKTVETVETCGESQASREEKRSEASSPEGLVRVPPYSPATPYSLKSQFLPRQISRAKPNYTYTDLITLALRDKTSLTVSEIYQWISENFPYFRADDDRWKNSVRHNLSMNPHFRKGTKSKSGSGHVWVLAGEGGPSQTPDGDTPVKLISNETEAAEAVRNILSGRHPRQNPRVLPPAGPEQSGYPETLQRSAEQILAGVVRPTAVESAVSPVTSLAQTLQFVPGDLRQRQPVNSNHFEITVYEHQSAALTLSSLDQIASSSSSSEISCSQFLNIQQF